MEADHTIIVPYHPDSIGFTCGLTLIPVIGIEEEAPLEIAPIKVECVTRRDLENTFGKRIGNILVQRCLRESKEYIQYIRAYRGRTWAKTSAYSHKFVNKMIHHMATQNPKRYGHMKGVEIQQEEKRPYST